MKILFDGGAFQQGISGGILNVAINFLNAAADLRPDLKFVLLADPFFGEVRPEFLAKLTVTPEIVYRPVLRRPAERSKTLTPRPGLQVLVDNTPHPFKEAGDYIEFGGDITPRTLEIRSRSARPSDVFERSNDTRRLGVGFTRIEVDFQGTIKTYYFDDPRFDGGSHSAEGDLRWTSGRFVLPKSMLPSEGPWRIRFFIPHRIHYELFEGRFDAKLDTIVKETLRLEREHEIKQLSSEMREMGIEAYFANHFIPISFPEIPLFTWAYDIIPIVHPEFFNRDALENFAEVVRVLTSSNAVFCISRFTKRSILNHLPIHESRLHVTWIGTSAVIYRRSSNEVTELRARRSLPRPYIVCVATIEPRKNHVTLIEAYNLLVRMSPEAPDLVVAGARGWGYETFFAKVREFNLAERVHHLEHLSDDEIAILYSGAVFCVYPSRFEGFGLPVLEAMRCGIPVVTSRNTSMEEIVDGGAGLLVDPASPLSIAKAMQLLLADPNRAATIVAKAAERVPLFDWPVIAKSILSVMESQLR